MPEQRLNTVTERCESCTLCNSRKAITIKSEACNLAHVRDFIKSIGDYCELSEKQLFDLQVAVGEATANAIEHGSPAGSANCVDIASWCNRRALTIAIKDQGTFKRRLPTPDLELSFRGRGIPLMLALVDSVTIDEAKDGTRVVLVKDINGESTL